MLKIKHFHDTNALNSATLSSLALDNDTIVVDASKQEIFRFVKPKVLGTTTFSAWKDNLPKKTYSHLGSTSTFLKGFKDLTSSFSLYDSDAIFISSLSNRFMLNLNHNWQKKIGGANNDYGYAIAVDSSGNVYLNGHQASNSYGGFDYDVVKLDTHGNLLWQKKIGGANNDYGYAIAVDSSGNVYLNGRQTSDSYGNYEYGVIKMSGTQTSDMNLSVGNMNLSVGNMNLSIGNSNLSIGDSNLSIGNMNLSIGNSTLSGVSSSGTAGGLKYIGN